MNTDDKPAILDYQGSETPAQPRRVVRGDSLRHAMRNGTTAWMFGNVWFVAISGSAFTLFIKGMNASPFQFGLLTALQYLSALVSIPAALLIEHTGKRRRIFFWGLYFQRGLWFALAILPIILMHRYGVSGTRAALNLFIILFFIMHAGNAVGGPAWVSWMADLVPERVRGHYFAKRRQWSVLTAIPAALVVGWMLDRYATGGMSTMHWCAIIFCGAAVFGLMDIVLFHFVPDVPTQPRRGGNLLKAMAKPLHDKQYLWFAGYVATLMFAVVPMGQFVTLYAIEKVGLKNRVVQLMLLVLPMVAQFVVLPVWGKAADRMGKKPLLVMATLGLVPVGVGWCLVAPGTAWVGYLMAALGGALWTGVEIANFNLVLEMSGSEGKSGGTAYQAVNSVILNVSACLGGLAWGTIAQLLKDWSWTPIAGWKTLTSFDVLFVTSGLLRLLAVVIFLPHIREHEAKPTREAIRFMGANIYNNLFNALLQPLRFLGVKKSESYPEADETKP